MMKRHQKTAPPLFRGFFNRRIVLAAVIVFLFLNIFIFGRSFKRVYGEEMYGDLNLVPTVALPPSSKVAVPRSSLQYLMKARELQSEILPVIVIGCNRVSIERALDPLIKYRKNDMKFPIIVSLDCGVQAVEDLITTKYGSKLTLWKTPVDLHQEVIPQSEIDMKHTGYYKLATHYKWALAKVFSNKSYNNVIILEDDMEISPDFFSYFEETLPLLYSDPTLFCISSWNDQGKKSHVSKYANGTLSSTRIMRTDFFPGLGWLLTRDLYSQIAPTWPETEWDDWLRRSEQRRGRQCLIPEVSRNRNFGSEGVSGGQFFEEHIALIAYAGEGEVANGPTANNMVDFSTRRKVIANLANPEYNSLFEKGVYDDALLAKWDLRFESKYMTVDFGSTNGEAERIVRKELALQPDWPITLEILNDFVKSAGSNVNKIGKVFTSTKLGAVDEAAVYSSMPSLRLEYESVAEMQAYLAGSKMMSEVRSGIPRSGCRGVTQFVYDGRILIFIAPSKIARARIMNSKLELVDESKRVIKIMYELGQ
ncbi:GNT-I family-domain-containing protein [Obelidium mucronatum]|nr:GNT-I family-domain-containing protein [Obelidium mucronatum]